MSNNLPQNFSVYCKHKFIHKSTDIRYEVDARGNSRCYTWIQVDEYFCEKCLDEKSVKKSWNGQPDDSDRPDWSKAGEFRKVYI